MRSAISFLTPVGPAKAPGPTTLDWFAPAGAVIGLALGGFWWLTARAWPLQVAAALVVVADLAITGLLHLDGLADSADGLLPHLSPSRRLQVMSTPEVGAFGVGVAGVVLLLRWAALASLRPGILLLGGLWCLSRTAMAIVARTRPYARSEGGLASAFSGPTRWLPLGAGIAGGLALCAGWRVGHGLAAGGAALVGATFVAVLADRRIGGYTGDVLGACAVVAETTGLLMAATKW